MLIEVRGHTSVKDETGVKIAINPEHVTLLKAAGEIYTEVYLADGRKVDVKGTYDEVLAKLRGMPE